MKLSPRIQFYLITFFLLLAGLGLQSFLMHAPTRNRIQHWEAPAWADTLNHPGVNDPQWALEGEKIYLKGCIVCHGEGGRGDGESGFGLSVPPGDFCDEYTRSESNGSLYWKITYGKSPMPAYLEKMNATQRWKLVAYIRSLQTQFMLQKSKSKHKKR